VCCTRNHRRGLHETRGHDGLVEHVLVATENSALRITLNWPAKKHALTQAMYTATTEALALFASGPDVQAAI
jgi:enoyl-CoA hydratase/carnithine racemase